MMKPYERPHILIFAILFCAAMFVYSGRVLNIDGRATLATSATLASHGLWDMNILASEGWTAAGAGGQVVVAEDGDSYSKKAPLVALAHVPLVALGNLLPFQNSVQLALLTIPIAYALTGVLLYLATRRLGLPDAWAIVAALWWGLATFALANTKEVFAEPLMALGVALALYAIVPATPIARSAWLAGVGGALIVGGNLAAGIMLPFLLLALWRSEATWRQRAGHLIQFALPIGLMVLLVAYLNDLRSGSIFSSGYRFGAGEGFTTPLWVGLSGLLVSGFRGVIWYAPITALAPLALITQAHRKLNAILLAMCAAQVLLFATWWAWHGGGGWGPRFLLPLLPVLVLLALPSLRWLWQWGRAGRYGVVALGLASLVAQMAGLFVHYIYYDVALFSRYDTHEDALRALSVMPLHQSPIIQQWPYFRLDDTWTAWGQDTLLAGCALFALLLCVCWLLVERRINRRMKNGLALAAVGGAALLAVSVATLRFDSETAVLMQDFYTAQAQADDPLLWNASSGWRLINVPDLPYTYSIPSEVASNDPQAREIVQQLDVADDTIWYATSQPNPNWLEARLWAEGYVGTHRTVGDYRLMLVNLSELMMPLEPLGITFETITLAQMGFQWQENNLLVALHWQGMLPQGATMFVHVLDASGNIIQQHDRLPLNGYINEEAATIRDRHLFPIPPGIEAAALRIGWVDDTGAFIRAAGDDFLLVPLD